MTIRPFFCCGWVHVVLFVLGVLAMPAGPAWRVVLAAILLMVAGAVHVSTDK